MINITLPLHIMIPRKTKADKKWILNLNNYRNTHYQVLSDAKIEYSKVVKKEIGGVDWKIIEKAKIIFEYYHGSKRRVDKSNPCSIIEKFACDALTDIGLWVDDDSEHIPITEYRWGGVDKNNPRCELIIEELYI